MGVADVDFDEMYAKECERRKDSFKGKMPIIEKQFEDFWNHPDAQQDVDAYFEKLSDDQHKYAKRVKWVQPKTIFTDFAQKSLAGNQNVLIIDEIKELFRKEWSDPTFREAVLRHQREAIKRQHDAAVAKAGDDQELVKRAEKGYELATEHLEGLADKILQLKYEDFSFGLHLYSDHSICHFHMHIIAMPEEMRQYSTSQHDEKTKDVSEVREAIETFNRQSKSFDR
ncbi:hypothetical protein PG994_007564 [Apiospora phragmitis]|uniref:HIT domain-containing protein n=1 Tax=Apiospora phragmitis TaxID=2905665 RepID=A0ABR1V3M7_9PEZI